MEKKKPTKLAIAGKVIDISKIGEKTLAQFRAQLKANGITLEEDSLERLYHHLHDEEPEQVVEPAAEPEPAAEAPAEETPAEQPEQPEQPAEESVEPKAEEE